MQYPLALTGFEGQQIAVQAAGFLAGPKLLVNGQPAAKGPKRGQMLLRRNDGRAVIATWKAQLIDVPQLVVDGQTVHVVAPLPWYVWLWSGLPFLLVFLGGAVGAFVGLIGFSVNAKIFRSTWPMLAKFAVTAVVSGVAAGAYLVVITLIYLAVY